MPAWSEVGDRHRPGVGPLHGRVTTELRAQRDPAAPGPRGQARPEGQFRGSVAAVVVRLSSGPPLPTAIRPLNGCRLRAGGSGTCFAATTSASGTTTTPRRVSIEQPVVVADSEVPESVGEPAGNPVPGNHSEPDRCRRQEYAERPASCPPGSADPRSACTGSAGPCDKQVLQGDRQAADPDPGGVVDGVGDRSRGTDDADLADPLGAQGD